MTPPSQSDISTLKAAKLALSTLRDFLAYHLVMVLPIGRIGGFWYRIEHALLPYAGGWAYRDRRP